MKQGRPERALSLPSLPGSREQFRDRNAERVCQLRDVVHGDVSEGALNSTHVSAVQIRLLGQAFLRPTPGRAEVADSFGELANSLIRDLLVLWAQVSSLKGRTLKIYSLKVTTVNRR